MTTLAMTTVGQPSTNIALVVFPGGVWTATQFIVNHDASPSDLCESVKRLNRLNLCSQWALGDLGIALQDFRRAALDIESNDLISQAEGTEDSEHRQRLLAKAKKLEHAHIDYMRDLAKSLGVDDGHWRDCIQLARFFPPGERHDTLYPHHHRVAMRAARRQSEGEGAAIAPRGQAKARGAAHAWLAEAVQHGYTTPQLRRKVNTALATAPAPKHPPEADPYAELNAADEWAITFRSSVPSLSIQQCIQLRSLMQGIRELDQALLSRIERTGDGSHRTTSNVRI
jgi:hypothetical protein